MNPNKGGTSFYDSPRFFLVGAFAGFLSATVLIAPRLFCSDRIRQSHALIKLETPIGPLRYCTDQNLVFVGVMTSNEFLSSRAAAAYSTWGDKNFPGKVVFFAPEDAGNGAVHPPGLEVVPLKGVDDVYPPQKKAFLMLKYMHDRYLNNYRFFMRVDDDSYLRGDELAEFLHSVKTSNLVIGSAGWGQPKELGKLGLRPDENYCQGGPGMIVPRDVLRLTGPKIKTCVKDLYSIHEDVELGRCFKSAANASCTLAYEKPFYQNYRDYKGCFNHSLDDDGIAESITLHPVKTPSYVYRLYQHFNVLKSKKLYSRLQGLSRDIFAMKNILLAKSRTGFFDVFEAYSCSRGRRSADGVCPWVFLSDDRYSPYASDPKLRKPRDERIAENATLKQILGAISSHRHLGEKAKTTDIRLLYSRLVQLQGLDYIFTLPKTIWNKRPGDAKGFLQFYARRPFLQTEMAVESRPKLALTSEPYAEITVNSIDKTRVNIIVALVGKYATFLEFVKTFEDRIVKTKQNVSLLLVVLRDPRNGATADKVISDIEVLGRKYRDTPLATVLAEGGATREEAIRSAIQSFGDDDLLFLSDVEMDFDASTLQRIRLNTKLGERVYMPISFSEFDQNSLSGTDGSSRKKRTVRAFDAEAGYWPRHSFRTLSCYKLDCLRTGDLKSDANGTGLDDSDVPEKFSMSEINILRSADVGLTQRYNPASCKTSINKTHQRDTCFATISSTETLSEYVYRTSAILNRGQSTR